MLGGFVWKVSLYYLSKNTFQVFSFFSFSLPSFPIRAQSPVVVLGGRWQLVKNGMICCHEFPLQADHVPHSSQSAVLQAESSWTEVCEAHTCCQFLNIQCVLGW